MIPLTLDTIDFSHTDDLVAKLNSCHKIGADGHKGDSKFKSLVLHLHLDSSIKEVSSPAAPRTGLECGSQSLGSESAL